MLDNVDMTEGTLAYCPRCVVRSCWPAMDVIKSTTTQSN